MVSVYESRVRIVDVDAHVLAILANDDVREMVTAMPRCQTSPP
jgi:hypothetical protein